MGAVSAEKELDWKTMYQVVSACGEADSPRALATSILQNISRLCPFDQGLAYFFDANGKICGQQLWNIDEQWSFLYLNYYANRDQHYSCYKNIRENINYHAKNIAWGSEPTAEFVSQYIHPRGIQYTYGFGLFDLNGAYRTVIALDRVGNANFSKAELSHVGMVVRQLNQLHKNFFYHGIHLGSEQPCWEIRTLTPREREIAQLLCQGITPTNISRMLYISPATTNKHISHIYEKLHVSNLQELLVLLLNSSSI